MQLQLTATARFALRDGTRTIGYFETIEQAIEKAHPGYHIRKHGPDNRTVARYTHTGVQVSGAKAPSLG